MADNVAISAGAGTTVAADDVGGVMFQRVKVTHGVDGAAVDASATNPLPVLISASSFVAPAATFVDRSGTITTGGTAQQAAAANASRTFLMIHNPDTTTDLWFSTTATASATAGSGGSRLGPGGFAFFDNVVPAGAVSVLSATTGKAFTVKEV